VNCRRNPGSPIASIIANNGGQTGLTKSRTGLLTLSNAADTYSGKTFLNGGITNIAADTKKPRRCCGVTESVASMVAAILRRERVSQNIVGQLRFGRWGENLAADVLEVVLRAMADAGHRGTAIGILAERLKSNSGESERWKPLSLELVTAPELVRTRDTMAGYHWKQVANTIIKDHPGEIAAAVFREQANRESDNYWSVKHSEAEGVLLACVERDPGKVWQAMRAHLSSPADAAMFSVGFPGGVVERMLPDDVGAWIAERPEERAATVARLTSKDMSTDETLASRVLGRYGDSRRVASAFFAAYISGFWTRPDSSHWNQLAGTLDAVATRTALPKLRRWASDSARHLRKMAERDRQREQEEDLRGR
jgi:autotransporter-associated beta strand protein